MVPKSLSRLPSLRSRGPCAPRDIRLLSTTPSKSTIQKVPLWVSGKEVFKSSAGTVTQKHTRTRQDSCEVVVAGEKETSEAAEISREAFQAWRGVSAWERRAILRKVPSLMQERFEEWKGLLLADTVYGEVMLGVDLDNALHLVDGAAETCVCCGSLPPTVDGSLGLVSRVPYGPVLSIPAFNFPLCLAMRSIVYPLASGNTVILRGSSVIPQASAFLGPLFADAGIPEGVLQILNFSEHDAGARTSQLIADDNVRFVNFTGSTKLGKNLARQCGEHLKPSVLELGGKAPALILPSADLELAANNVLFGAFLNSGQICMSTERVIVHQDVAAEFESILKREAEKADWNGGMELVRSSVVETAQAMAKQAIESGARIVFSAPESSTDSLNAVRPTIFTDLPSTATILNEESFAPFFTLQTAPDIPSMIRLANSHETGLSSSVFGQGLDAIEVAEKMEMGTVHINGMSPHDQHVLPHGGTKNSGWGRFNGKSAVESFTQMKVIRIDRQKTRYPLSALYAGL
ncbi:hypothetical protein I350_07758 [Cryptococcus amylolentus CBS 6273]|uniref:Aldehyde dehydrogenase domain-containing protein n=1 Tax=Cryptococcus amylolentus CBS 6273 TaxID=1296118 RepID=A0A1E3JDD4_9TREE|nr:hypothetical protein I350_07758 [Cryptococcus amylolentus CBS 6273]